MAAKEICNHCFQQEEIVINSKSELNIDNLKEHIASIMQSYWRFSEHVEEYHKTAHFFNSSEEIQQKHDIKSNQKILMFYVFLVSRGIIDILKFHLPMTVINKDDQKKAESALRLMCDTIDDLQRASDIFNSFSTPKQKECIIKYLGEDCYKLDIGEFLSAEKMKVHLKETPQKTC